MATGLGTGGKVGAGYGIGTEAVGICETAIMEAALGRVAPQLPAPVRHMRVDIGPRLVLTKPASSLGRRIVTVV